MALTTNEITQKLAEQDLDWEFDETENALKKVFGFDDFVKALEFANKIGELAEQNNHHPKLIVEWGKVTVYFTTHSAGGVTTKDFEMVKEVEKA